jgi:RNA polymerase sigma-70 factor, ECF subfamily
VEDTDFETIVDQFYKPLYRFALSLAKNESEACDLTQETFYLWGAKNSQMRDRSKAKSWLFTTLHRQFLGLRRREARFSQHEIDQTENEFFETNPRTVEQLDGATAMEAIHRVEEPYRTPLVLFYLEDHSYQEIAEILDVPAGTVMSRLSRAKAKLRHILGISNKSALISTKIIQLNPATNNATKLS